MKLSHGAHTSGQSSLPTTSCGFGCQILILLAMMFLARKARAQNYVFERLWPQLPQPWYFNYPGGVSVGASGNAFVADSSNNRIQVFDSSGTFLKKMGRVRELRWAA